MRLLPIVFALSSLPAVAAVQEKVNADSHVLDDFSKRVAEYGKLRKTALSQVHSLKPTNSPEAIELHERELARQIRESRGEVAQGNIFTPPVAAEFRRLLGITLRGPEAERIRASLKHASPLEPRPLTVNAVYPVGLPLQSTPPSLLLNLPPLPPGLEYRIVGRALILRDADANLIVDIIPNAIP